MNADAQANSTRAGLVRVLGRRDTLALALGAMIGWAWIPLAGPMLLSGGSLGAVTAFAIGGFAIVLIGLIYAELASAMPQVGGVHVYSYRALGRLASFVCTWAIVFGYVSVVAFEAVALPTVVQIIFPNYAQGDLWTIAGWDVKVSWVAVGVAGSLVMMAINYVGVTMAALIQRLVTVVIVLVGLMFATGAVLVGEVATLEPLFVGGWGGVMAVLVMVPFLFVGFDVIPQAAEEIDLPSREIGKLITLSVALALVFYVFMVLGTGLLLPAERLEQETLAVPAAMQVALGTPWAANLVIFAGIAGIITSWNAFYIGGSRAIYALASAGMLPKVFATLHPRYRTPTMAILLIGGLSALAPLLGRPMLVWLVNAGGLGIVVAYLFVAISFVMLRRREPQMARPYRVQHGNIVGALGALLSLGFILLYLLPVSPSGLSPLELALFGGWMMLGFAMYAWSVRRYGAHYADEAMRAALARSAR